VILGKSVLPALALGALLFVVSCQEPSATVELVSPKNGARVQPTAIMVRVRWTGVNAVADSIKLFIEGETFPTMGINPMPETVAWVWHPNVPDGTQRWLVTALYYHGTKDPATRDEWDSVQVTVDSGRPVVRFVAPADGDTLEKGDVPLKVWAVDGGMSGMDRVEFLVDDVLDGTVTFSSDDTWRHTWEASGAAAGAHSLKAKAYNMDGTVGTATIDVTIRDTTSGGGPTHHGGYVDTSETWSPRGNPHIVDSTVTFRSSAWLTIEPGCIVKFDTGYLAFGTYGASGLTAVGTAAAPILLTSNRAAPAPGNWGGINFGAQLITGTRLSYCTIEYGGYNSDNGAAIAVGGSSRVDEISNCMVRQSGRFGVYCGDNSGFGVFRSNQVTSNRGYGIHVGPQMAELLDDGNVLSGNDSLGVELYGRLSVSTTWPELGVPYVISDVYVYDSTSNPVLTIESGTEIRFKNLGRLRIGNVGVPIPARIVADGTSGRIKFTSAAASPAPGNFYGVYVYGNQIGESEFKSCDFSYGGQNGDCLLYVKNSNPVITGCDFGYSAGWGISFKTASAPDTMALKAANTFHDNTLGNIKWVPPFPGD